MSNHLSTYLKIVKEGIKNKDKIIEALKTAAEVKNGIINDEALAEILRRKEICAHCPFNSKNKPGYDSPPGYGEHCTLCLCRIGGDDTKEYCLTCNCGIQAFNEANPDLPPQKLFWEEFKPTNKENEQ